MKAEASGGSTTQKMVLHRDAPSVAEASSISGSISARTGSTLRTMNGRPMKTNAMKMPSGVKAILTPKRSKNPPIQPFGA